MNDLAAHYRRFRVSERVLLTGHSHQAWPDVAFDGVAEAFDDAATYVDDKWARAAAKADAVRDGYRRLLGAPDATIALGANTHELVVRFLSALPWRERATLVTTSGEFHSARRQLARLAEEGIDVVVVPAEPVATLAARVADAVDHTTLAVLVSSVLFSTAAIVPGLAELARACSDRGAELLVDLYHHLGALPFDGAGLERAWLVGGGYKYLQLGEGNCFLRVPGHATELRPVITGWYAEFESLPGTGDGRVTYAPGGDRFAGATYDPTSHYRAARVFAFFDEQGLSPDALRARSLGQTRRIASAAGLTDDREQFGGFVAVRTPAALALRDGLRSHGVHTDVRGDILRLGPAPYVSDDQLEHALDVFRTLLRSRMG